MANTLVTKIHPAVAYVVLKQVYNTAQECDELIRELQFVYDEHIQSGKSFIFVFNTEFVNYCQPGLLKRFASWMSSKRAENEQYLLCSYIILTNPTTRVAFNSVISMFKPSKAYYVRESAEEVNKELKAKLIEHGLA